MNYVTELLEEQKELLTEEMRFAEGKELEQTKQRMTDVLDALNKLSIHGVVSSKITVLITYNETDVVFGCFRTTKKTKIIEVDDLKNLNKLRNDLVDVKILK